MSEKKNPPLESPFSKRQTTFREIDLEKSHPATDSNDPRLRPEQANNFKGNTPKPGDCPAPKPSLKPLSEALRKKLEEKAEQEGKTFAEMWAEIILNGVTGKVKLTPSQTACMTIIRDTIEGKPSIAKEDDSDRTMIVWGDITAVDE